MNLCVKCGAEKTRIASGRIRCLDCDNAYQRMHYLRNPEKIRIRKRDSMRKQRATPDGRLKQRRSAKRWFVNVKCSLSVSPQDETIRLCPLPGQIEQAENEAVDLLAAVIKAALPEVPVFCGTP